MEWATTLSAFLGAALGVVVTLFSERIRAKIAGESWLAQERWTLRRDTYISLLRSLFAVRFGIQKALLILDQADEDGTAKGAEIAIAEAATLISTEIASGVRALREHRVVGALWLRPETLDALQTVADTLSELKLKDPGVVTAIDAAVTRVVAEAKHDLRLGVHGV